MNDFKSLFTENTPLIDVRAPLEFEQGHFPGSVNLPLMNDDERKLVGTEYKLKGQAEALALGHSLVKGDLKAERVEKWLKFLSDFPHAKLYCFRGGLRSEISKAWIAEQGREIEMIPGGFKALRRSLVEAIEKEVSIRDFILLAGRTGSGKTRVLKKVRDPSIDLEKLANHKGSSFGSLGKQPAQVTFENELAIEFLKVKAAGPIVLEDEGAMIGSVVVPKILFEKMRYAPLVVLEREMPARVENIAAEYVFEKTQSYQGDFSQTHQFMIQALDRIKAKLGGLQHSLITQQLDRAFHSPKLDQVGTHALWIESLLTHYYDPLYDRGLKKSAERVCFQGNEEACLKFLLNNTLSPG